MTTPAKPQGPEGECWEDQLLRVQLMAQDNNKWDLSPHDRAALKAVLERLAALNAGALGEAVEALRPFAALLDRSMESRRDEQPVYGIGDAIITAGDLRRAARTLQSLNSQGTTP